MATEQMRRGGNRRSNATAFDLAEAGSGDGGSVNPCRALTPSTLAEHVDGLPLFPLEVGSRAAVLVVSEALQRHGPPRYSSPFGSSSPSLQHGDREFA